MWEAGLMVDETTPETNPPGRGPEGKAPIEPIPIQVVWGDITKTRADVYAVGHYQGVLPQNAEWALDTAISGVDPEAFGPDDHDCLVLTKLTRNGLIRGALGDVDLFPWGGAAEHRLIAVCGMGHPGAFDQTSIRRLYRSLAWTLTALPSDRTLCTVVIGTGEGALSVEASVRGLLAGLNDAVAAGEGRGRILRVMLCELIRSRAERIHVALRDALKDEAWAFHLEDEIVVAPGGRVNTEQWLAMLSEAAGRAASAEEGSSLRAVFDDLVNLLPEDARDPTAVAKALDEVRTLGEQSTEVVHLARPRRGLDKAEHGTRQIPTRMSFVRDGPRIRAAAITNTTTVSERIIEVDPTLLQEGVRRMTRAKESEVPYLSELIYRLTLPRDFRGVATGQNPVVVEVDRDTATVHWEMLALGVEDGVSEPAGLRRPVARQMRTTYSPGAVTRRAGRKGLQALIIGDPSDPAKGMALPGARQEAIAVWKLLSERFSDGDVILMVGPPTPSGAGSEPGFLPATRLDVLGHLLSGEFDVVHYSGHGTFDPNDPAATGWVFQDGLLTAREVERIDYAPSLIFANACLSSRTSQATTHQGGVAGTYGEAGLLPSLADEFFKRGVPNYIGTAWQVPDRAAVDFALAFYDAFLLTEDENREMTLGAAMLAARRQLHDRASPEDEAVWAAYQHYGDPGFLAREM
jgi:CHAT domain